MTDKHDWQEELRNGFRDLGSLLHFLEIPPQPEWMDEPQAFPLRVPKSFAQRMQKGNSKDPLLLQILPTVNETLSAEGFREDAVGDLKSTLHQGIIQKYRGRLLVILTGTCAVHCRYCFRRHFPYHDQRVTAKTRDTLLQLLKNDPSIEEVIFSGGDPLLLNNEQLQQWQQELFAIPTIRRWRIHTRLPSVLPQRIDAKLTQILESFQREQRNVVIVTHINHPNEINGDVYKALTALKMSQITLLNQAVLLKGINDDLESLKTLSEKLFVGGVLPYYLHLLDRARGTHHFDLPLSMARALYRDLSAELPGYLVPKLVREVEGEAYKVVVGPY